MGKRAWPGWAADISVEASRPGAAAWRLQGSLQHPYFPCGLSPQHPCWQKLQKGMRWSSNSSSSCFAPPIWPASHATQTGAHPRSGEPAAAVGRCPGRRARAAPVPKPGLQPAQRRARRAAALNRPATHQASRRPWAQRRAASAMSAGRRAGAVQLNSRRRRALALAPSNSTAGAAGPWPWPQGSRVPPPAGKTQAAEPAKRCRSGGTQRPLAPSTMHNTPTLAMMSCQRRRRPERPPRCSAHASRHAHTPCRAACQHHALLPATAHDYPANRMQSRQTEKVMS
jgi:hypothetical protein